MEMEKKRILRDKIKSLSVNLVYCSTNRFLSYFLARVAAESVNSVKEI